MANFDIHKKTTLAKLGKPDKSRATTADPHIRSLLDTINSCNDYYTTSSCSGRIMVLEESDTHIKKDVIWHYTSHDTIEPGSIIQAAKKGRKNIVWFKYEPLILHVACRDADAAQKLLVICGKSGLKHSGAITLGKRFILEIIGNERIDTPIAQGHTLLVTDEYLTALVHIANKKLSENLKRLEKIEKEVKISN